MKSSKIKHLIISSILCLATVGIFLVFGKNLPDIVPVHWDKFQGSEKATWKYYLVPLSVIAISFLVIFLALR